MKKYFIFIILVIAALFVPFWIQGKVFGTFDLAHITVPIEQLFARYQADGNVPAWAPEFNAGFPLMANGFQSFYYFPHVLLRPILPAIWLVNVSLMLHMLLAAGGMWLLLRSQRLSPTAAAVGALVFAAGGYFVGRITLPHLFFPAAWIPLVLWGIIQCWYDRSIARAALLAMFAALLVLSGHIQIVLYAVVASVLLIAVLILKERQRSLQRIVLLIGAGILAALLTAVHVLPVLEHLELSRRGVELEETEAFDVSYPAYHLASLVSPGMFGLGEEYRGPKNQPELMMYTGAVGLILVLVGACSKHTYQNPLGLVAAAYIALGFALAGGGNSPLYVWIHSLDTPLAGFANPGRAILLVHIGLSVFAAFGVDRLVRSMLRIRALWLATGLAALGVLAWAVSGLVPDSARQAVQNSSPQAFGYALGAVVLAAAALCIPGFSKQMRRFALIGVVSLELIVLALPTFELVQASVFTKPLLVQDVIPTREDAPRIFSQTKIEPVSFGDFGITPGIRISTATQAKQRVVIEHSNLTGFIAGLTWNTKPAAPGEVFLELRDVGGNLVRSAAAAGLDITPEEPLEFIFEPIVGSGGGEYDVILSSTYSDASAPTAYIHGNPDGKQYNPRGSAYGCNTNDCVELSNTDWGTTIDLNVRPIYADPADRYLPRELLIPMFGEGEGYTMVRAHLSLQWQRFDDYLRALGERADFESEYLARNQSMLDRLSVGTVMASFDPYRELQGLSGMELIKQAPMGDREIHIYRNLQAYPRIHVARQAVTASEDEARHLIYNDKLAIGTVVIEDAELPDDLAADTNPVVAVLRDDGEYIAVQVTSESPQLLVVRDVNLPGWTANLDGELVVIGTVDTLFKGVVVPAGEHVVEFVYHSPALGLGNWVSGLSWILVGGLAVWNFQKKLKK